MRDTLTPTQVYHLKNLLTQLKETENIEELQEMLKKLAGMLTVTVKNLIDNLERKLELLHDL